MDQATAEPTGLTRWDQQEAKAKFSEVVRRARSEGPQWVTTRGSKPVVVVSADDYLALIGRRSSGFADLLLPGENFAPERGEALPEHDLPIL